MDGYKKTHGKRQERDVQAVTYADDQPARVPVSNNRRKRLDDEARRAAIKERKKAQQKTTADGDGKKVENENRFSS